MAPGCTYNVLSRLGVTVLRTLRIPRDIARPRTTMRRIREVLRLSYEAALGAQQVSLATGLPRTTVRRYLEKASHAGLAWPLPEGMDDRHDAHRIVLSGESMRKLGAAAMRGSRCPLHQGPSRTFGPTS